MKKLVKIGLLFFCLCTGFAANAEGTDNETLEVSFKAESGKRVDVVIGAPNAHLYMTNLVGEIIYEENLQKTAKTKRTFDLSQLPEGMYKMVVETDLTQKKYNISVDGGKVKISKPLELNLVKTELTKKGKVATLSLKSLEKLPVEIEILNEYNEQLYAEKVADATNWTKKFDFAKGDGREFTFVVKSPSREFVQTIYKY